MCVRDRRLGGGDGLCLAGGCATDETVALEADGRLGNRLSVCQDA
jgi:hypothetical protein